MKRFPWADFEKIRFYYFNPKLKKNEIFSPYPVFRKKLTVGISLINPSYLGQIAISWADLKFTHSQLSKIIPSLEI